jgi:hypothetical protein
MILFSQQALIVSSHWIVNFIAPLLSHNVPVPVLAVPDDEEWYRCISFASALFYFIPFCKVGYLSV